MFVICWSRRRELNSRPLPYQGSALPLSYAGLCLRAEDEVRTRDPQLGRLMLYRLSYFRGWWYVKQISSLRSLIRFGGAFKSKTTPALPRTSCKNFIGKRVCLCNFLSVLPCPTGRELFLDCGERRIRTSEVVRQQIYSLLHLATLVSPRM